LPTKLLESLVPQRTSEALLGDLIEQFDGGRSRTWYWRQAILALVISAGREVRTSKLRTGCAILVGYLTGASLCYFTTSLAARLVESYTAVYLVFLPLAFGSAAASGWVVRRSFPRAMVLVFSGFCVVASVAAFAVYAWLPVFDRIPVPFLVLILVTDFIVAPLGVLAGGLWGSPGPNDVWASTAGKAT
jgi:hypothetical protein